MSSKAEADNFVTALFRGLLRRDPDMESLSHFTDEIMNGRPHLEVLEEFMKSQEYQDIHKVKLFVPPGHFYSPIVPPEEGLRQIERIENAPYPHALQNVGVNRADIVATWNKLLPYLRAVPFPDQPSAGFRYAFNNPAYSTGDGSILHAMLRLHRPKRMIEIGSGWSSACTVDTISREGIDCQLTFIEPYPQLLLSLLGPSKSNVNIVPKRIQDVSLHLFDALQSGDFLFIDSTHIVRTGSDVCYEIFDILPRLAPGVIVHIHDIFWPFEYPRTWVIDENRSWNELYLIRAFLSHNRDWKVVFFNDYMARMESELASQTFPRFMSNPGSALWLQRI